jgi:cytochrome c
MRTTTRTLIAAAAVLLQSGARVAAQSHGTPSEARAMLDKAVQHYQSVGRAQALADFTKRQAPFFDRDLYVVCIGPNRVISAHGGFPQYVGTSADVLKDAAGKPLGQAILSAAGTDSVGTVRYQMLNLVSGRVQPKVSFVRKVGSDVCVVGAYE